MSEKRTETCKCGQVTHLVIIAGVECYDVDVHGSSAVAEGRCFNCHVPFVSAAAERIEPLDETEPEDKELSEMTVKELKVLAADNNIELPKKGSKAAILEAIEEANRTTADEDTSDEIE